MTCPGIGLGLGLGLGPGLDVGIGPGIGIWIELGKLLYKIRSPNAKLLSIVQIPHDLGIAFNFDVLHKDSTRDEF